MESCLQLFEDPFDLSEKPFRFINTKCFSIDGTAVYINRIGVSLEKSVNINEKFLKKSIAKDISPIHLRQNG